MCWCRRGYDDCGPDGAFVFLDALDFVPCVMCPHWEDWPAFLTDVKTQDLDGLGIDNDIAVAVVDGEEEAGADRPGAGFDVADGHVIGFGDADGRGEKRRGKGFRRCAGG